MVDGLIGVVVSVLAVWVLQWIDIDPNKIPFDKGPERIERYVTKHKDQVKNRVYSDWAESLMIYAIEEDHRAVLDSLISFGYPLDQKIEFDSTEVTPLTAAILAKNEYITRQLAAGGADPNIMSQGQFHPLLSAILAEFQPETISALLKAGANPNYFDKHHSTPISIAVAGEQFEVVDLLLASGADIDLLDSEDWAPLHYATIYGEGVLQSFLIDRGADVNVVNSQGISPLFTAAANGYEYIMLELLDRGAEVNQTNKRGETALVAAIQQGSLSCAYLLVEAGADIWMEFDEGRTPMSELLAARPYLHTPAYNEFLQILYDMGKLDGERPIFRGLTSLQIYYYAFADYLNEGREDDIEPELIKAYTNSVAAMTHFFKDKGYDFTQKPGDDWTVLHKLSTTSAPVILELVLTEYDGVDIKTSHGSTPLLLAIQTGNLASVKLLLEAGGDPNMLDSDGISGMDWALINGDTAIVERVEAAGGVATK